MIGCLRQKHLAICKSYFRILKLNILQKSKYLEIYLFCMHILYEDKIYSGKTKFMCSISCAEYS